MKAKLIELGSGTSSGYIDDELPDYVMIMVANKRSREQMIEDLSLFLDKNTDVFVNWLHQVLEKLQEVTLPAPSKHLTNFKRCRISDRFFIFCFFNNIDVHKSKKKASDGVNDKKDKKNKKKLKRVTKDRTADKELKRSNTPPLGAASMTSISDVFADHLMQKAKESLGEPAVMKTKSEMNAAKSSYDDGMNDDFDIPTITEIAKHAVEKVVCRKEFTELEELQKKINQAKRQLRQITDESEDDDFINLRADNRDLETAYSNDEPTYEPIDSVDGQNAVAKIRDTADSKITKDPITFSQSKETSSGSNSVEAMDEKRLSIRDRLGNKLRRENVISLSANRRVEQALYVPGYRRNESEKEMQIEPECKNKTLDEYMPPSTDTDDENNRISRSNRDQNYLVTDLRQKVQTKRLASDKSVRTFIQNRLHAGLASFNNRIGSRIVVAPPRSKVVHEKKKDTIVNSVVSIQPRPVVPKSKQACKSLLLRAVAEAQKSTALVKPTRDPNIKSNRSSKEQDIQLHPMEKLSPKRNIIVEVETCPIDIEIDESGIKEEFIRTNELNVEEYEPEYDPHLINRDLNARYVPY